MLKTTIKPALTTKIQITPKLQLSLKFLMYDNAELEEKVAKKIEDNPCLETQNKPFISSLSTTSKTNSFDPDNLPTQPTSLFSHFAFQMHACKLTELEKEIAATLLFHLKEDGFLENAGTKTTVGRSTTLSRLQILDPDSALKKLILNEIAKKALVPISWVEVVRKKLALLDPPGCFAVNLKESLLFQLNALGHSNHELPNQLISRFLHQLTQKPTLYFAKQLKAPNSHLEKAFQIIKRLKTKPANGFLSHTDFIDPLTPDIFLKAEADCFRVELVESSFFFATKVSIKSQSKLMKAANNEAALLNYALLKRKKTLEKVTCAIVRHQSEWFSLQGPLKPLTLKQIATQLDLHISTISRATKNKLLQTPRGVYPLKFFFQNNI